VRNHLPFINLYSDKSLKSKLDTQILYGETFKIIKKNKKICKIKNKLDGYKGFIKLRKFPNNQNTTHKVCNLICKLYLKPNLNYETSKKITFGSRVKVLGEKKQFYKVDNFWVKKSDIKKNNYKTEDIFQGVKKFLGVKYKWGGKHFSGVDCSALIQLFFHFNNKYCPRDSMDQLKYFKKNITLKNIKKNDLIFWKGHVALAISKKKLIHAYGPFKKVVIMSINRTIDRIQKTAKLKVIGIKRIT
tara:strand:- start:647 stop:1381 length:735 start_codon:yes stop_codon:yes gene_type:complete